MNYTEHRSFDRERPPSASFSQLPVSKALALTLLTIAATCCFNELVAAEPISTYRATYDISYRNLRVGTSEFSVTRDPAGGTYTFASTSRFQGLMRLVSPRPFVEISEFVYEQDRIQPLRYSYEGGNRRGEDNYNIAFDWTNGVATTTTQSRMIQSELTPGTLDRGSMQAAVMLDMRSSGPDRYTLVDNDGISIYEYSADGEETLDTPMGLVVAQKLIQQRRGSSRRTIIWMHSKLDYLPVRIEQQENSGTRATFFLQSFEWLGEEE